MKRLCAPRAMILAGLLMATTIGVSSGGSAADILIGTGGSETTHFDVARAICHRIHAAGQGLTCQALGIEGRDAAEPIAVLSGVRTGAIEIGIVSSEWQYHAFRGTGPFQFMDMKFGNLRSLYSLHAESFTLVARRDSGIERLDDLIGKRVNIGNPGSTHRAFMDMVMAAKGWSQDSFQLTEELAETELSLALCHDRVQAIVLMVAHPDATLAKTMELCDAKPVAVEGPEIDKLVADSGYLAMSYVPGGSYARIDKSVGTFGAVVTAVVSEDMAEGEAYDIVKAVFENLDDFKRLHPVLRHLSPTRMATDGLSAPLHPGALRYFNERGML